MRGCDCAGIIHGPILRICRMRLRGDQQRHQNQCRRPRPDQPPRQRQRRQHIRHQQHNRSGQQIAPQRHFICAGHTRHRNPRRPVKDPQFPVRRHRVYRQPAIIVLINTGAQIRPQPCLRQFRAIHPRQITRIGHTPEPVHHLQGFPDRSGQITHFGLRHRRGDRKPFQHLNEQAGQGQAAPFRVGGDVEQHRLALSDFLARHQRRAIAKLRDHPIRQCGIRLRHHLCRHLHIGRDGQAVKRAAFSKRCQRLGFAPAHCAAHCAPTCAQPHRHQRVFVIPAHLAGGQSRPSETHQNAALFNPIQNGLFLALGQGGDIGQNDHVGIGRDHIHQRPGQQIR